MDVSEKLVNEYVEDVGVDQAKKDLQSLLHYNSVITRSGLVSALGSTHDGRRNYYKEAGYSQSLSFSDFEKQYERNGLAKTIINAYPDATWRSRPSINENPEIEDTPFEKSWKDLTQRIDLYNYMRRVDRLSGKGRFAILILGFNDGAGWDKPVSRRKKNLSLEYVRPVQENHITLETYVTDKRSPRYGHPMFYNVNMTLGVPENGMTKSQYNVKIHHERVIHVTSEEVEESDLFSLPRLEAVYNRLQDIEVLSAGAIEMFWKGGFPGMVFDKRDTAEYTPTSLDELKTQIQQYADGLQRYLRTSGVDVNEFSPQTANPEGQFEMEMKQISMATRIPLRILYGAESGELASSQDVSNWDARVDERRKLHAEPVILKQFINRLVSVGALSAPLNGPNAYNVVWPDVKELDVASQVKIAETVSRTLHNYVRDGGLAETVIPVPEFLKYILKLPDDVVKELVEKDNPEARRSFQREMALKGSAGDSRQGEENGDDGE